MTQQVLSMIIIDIRGLAKAGGITGNYTPFTIALILSVVLSYWAYQVVWTPITPKPIVSINTNNPVLFGDRVLYLIRCAIIILAVIALAATMFPDKEDFGKHFWVPFFAPIFLIQFGPNIKGVRT